MAYYLYYSTYNPLVIPIYKMKIGSMFKKTGEIRASSAWSLCHNATRCHKDPY